MQSITTLTVRPSLFAKSSEPKIVYEELPLTTCINFLAVELKREILSYLHMGIILSLYEQDKSTILYCIRMERQDRNLSNSSISVFYEYSAKELIHIILFSEKINKKYIMRHLIDLKKREIQRKRKQEKEDNEQKRLALLLTVGDYFLNKQNYRGYLITKKTKCGFKAIKIGSMHSINKITVLQNPTIYFIKFINICTNAIDSEYVNKWLHQLDIVNNSPIICINNSEPVKKEDVVQFILTGLHSI